MQSAISYIMCLSGNLNNVLATLATWLPKKKKKFMQTQIDLEKLETLSRGQSKIIDCGVRLIKQARILLEASGFSVKKHGNGKILVTKL